MIKKALYLGLGLFSVTREKAEKLIDELMEKGEMDSEEGRQFLDDLIKRGEEEKQAIRNFIKDEMGGLKSDITTITRTELENLKARIEELEKKLTD